jgi:autotransporter-associated beta strand protein
MQPLSITILLVLMGRAALERGYHAEVGKPANRASRISGWTFLSFSTSGGLKMNRFTACNGNSGLKNVKRTSARYSSARLATAIAGAGLGLLGAGHAFGQTITLFTTQQDFTGWSVAGPTTTIGPSGVWDFDGSTTNGVGNNTAAGGVGTAGSLAINTGSNALGYSSLGNSPNLIGNTAAMQAIDPGYSAATPNVLVTASNTMTITYTAPQWANPADVYFELGVNTNYSGGGYIPPFFQTSNPVNDGTVNGMSTFTVTLPYTINSATTNGTFTLSPFVNAGTYGTGVSGVNNVLTAPMYIDAITVATPQNVNANWITNGPGPAEWATAANWNPAAVPDTLGSSATFGTNGGAITVSPTVDLATTQEYVGSLTLSSPLGYTFTGAAVNVGSLLTSTAGANTFAALTVGTGATISVAPGSSVTASAFSRGNYSQLTVMGGGTLNINTINNGNLTVSGGTTLNVTGSGTVLAGTSFLYGITVSTATDTLNLGTNNVYDSNSLGGAGTIVIGAGSTLTSAEFNGFTFNGALSGPGAVILGSAAGSGGTNPPLPPYTGTFLGASPNFSGPLTVAYLNTVQVGAAATLGNGSATNILTLDSGTLQATGNTTLSNPVVLADTQSITSGSIIVDSQTFTLGLTGHISGGLGLTKNGTGALVLGNSNTYAGATNVTAGSLVVNAAGGLPTGNSLTIGSGATVQLGAGTGGETLSAISFGDATSTLDIMNNHVFITDNAGVPATILAALKAGHASNWAGPGGIISTTASLHPGYGVAFGEHTFIAGIPSGQIEISYTLNGDINQDGVVNGTDFGILAGNFGKSVTGGWEQGDLNYDGTVNGTDFGLLAGNFGKSATGRSVVLPASEWTALETFASAHGLLADVPEPASVGMMVLAGAGALGRRRRR